MLTYLKNKKIFTSRFVHFRTKTRSEYLSDKAIKVTILLFCSRQKHDWNNYIHISVLCSML